MEFFETVEKRYSYRGPCCAQKVPRKDLDRIVRAGIAAPSGKNAQTTTFIIVDDPLVTAKIAAMEGAGRSLREAPALIACLIDAAPELILLDKAHFQIEDCAAAVENMLLAITALGYASVWIDGWLRHTDRARVIGRLLGVPDDKIVRVILPVGVPAEEGPRQEKKPFEERAWFNRYGAPA
ncbi:MAG: nitroreductase family protein [Planctomycetota bacterium]